MWIHGTACLALIPSGIQQMRVGIEISTLKKGKFEGVAVNGPRNIS